MRKNRFSLKEIEQLNFMNFKDGFDFDPDEGGYLNMEGYSSMFVMEEEVSIHKYDIKWASFTEPRDRYTVSARYGSYKTKGYIDIIAYFKDGILVKALVRDIEKCWISGDWQHLSGMSYKHYWLNNSNLTDKLPEDHIIETGERYRIYQFDNGYGLKIEKQINDLHKLTLIKQEKEQDTKYDCNIYEINNWLNIIKDVK